MNYLLGVAVSVSSLYAWAAITYLFFRFGSPETVERQRQFLEKYYFFFTFRTFKQAHAEVTPKAVREAGRRGWAAAIMTWSLLAHGMTTANVLLTIAMGYFGGVMFAYAWYGQRCLRMLGLEVYKKAAAV
ncbi:hypothetical protein [Prosthecobacter sp.]|uniref:hypothetical protein n=1 Tax=Prosthecobacter sp. TaxID=1965333 RepID=UPI003784B2B8